MDKNVIEVISPGAVKSASPFHTVSYVDVLLSPNPKDRDVYEQGGNYVSGQWTSTYALTNVGLSKLMNAAGIREISSNRTDDASHPYLVSWQYKAKWTQPDSTELEYSADYTCDLRGWVCIGTGEDGTKEQVRGARFEKAYMEDRDKLVQKAHTEIDWKKTKGEAAERLILEFLSKMEPTAREELEMMAEALALRRITQSRLFITQLAQTGAMDRVIRKFLGLKSAYTLDELKLPFSVPRSRFDWDRIDKVIGHEEAGNLKLIQAMKLLDITPQQYQEMKALSAPTIRTEEPSTLVETASSLGGVVGESSTTTDTVPLPPSTADTYVDIIEGVLAYRKWKSGKVQINVLGEWHDTTGQVGSSLNKTQKEHITGLFAAKEEYTNHLKKHFKKASGASLTWEELAGLLAWKEDNHPDPRWYSDKVKDKKENDAKTTSIIQGYSIPDPNIDDVKAFIEDMLTQPDPLCLLPDLKRLGIIITWEDKNDRESMRNLASVLAQGVVKLGTPEWNAMVEQSFVPF